MKKSILLVIFLMSMGALFAQSPSSFNYQAAVRDANGDILANQNVSFRISILEASASGTVLYEETHSVTTNDYGLVNLAIGTGTASAGDFTMISWGSNAHFIKTEMDVSGGSSFTEMSVQQLMSVPYALHAAVADSVKSNPSLQDSDGDTRFTVEDSNDIDEATIYIDSTRRYWFTDHNLEVIHGTQNLAIGYEVLDSFTVNPSQGANTALGYQVARQLVTGSYNTAIGWRAFVNKKAGYRGTALGAFSGYYDSATTANTALGYGTLYQNKNGNDNTAVGDRAMCYGNLLDRNVALGRNAMQNADSCSLNTAIGYHSLFLNKGDRNTALGEFSMYMNTEGNSNLALGNSAMKQADSGSNNVAVGSWALANTRVDNNTAVGYSSMITNTRGINNVAIGHSSMLIADSSNNNAAVGNFTLSKIKFGEGNVAVGYSAGYQFEGGFDNVMLGQQAMADAKGGDHNAAIGRFSLNRIESGSNNIAIGQDAIRNGKELSKNIGIGYRAMENADSLENNIAIGEVALYRSKSDRNTAIGTWALKDHLSGSYNTAIGHFAMIRNTSGANNTVVGDAALNNNITGSGITALGSNVLVRSTTSTADVAIGFGALQDLRSGSGNVTVGFLSGHSDTQQYNRITIGEFAQASSNHNAVIGNTSISSIGGYANWSNLSDGRFKTNVKEDVKGLDFIMALRPVTYNLDMDKVGAFTGEDAKFKNGIPAHIKEARTQKEAEVQSGFIAQEVEASAQELGYDFSGVQAPEDDNDHYTLRYAEFVVPLVKGMQEQQELILLQQAQIAQLRLELEQLKAGLTIIQE